MASPNTCTLFVLSFPFYWYVLTVVCPFNKHTANPGIPARQCWDIQGNLKALKRYLWSLVWVGLGRKLIEFGRGYSLFVDHVYMQLLYSLTSYLTPTCYTACLIVSCRCDMFRSQLLAIFKELAIFFDVCSFGNNLRRCDSSFWLFVFRVPIVPIDYSRHAWTLTWQRLPIFTQVL